MTQKLIPTWALGAIVAAFGLLGFLFIGAADAFAVDYYYVGTTDNWNTAASWDLTGGACDDAGDGAVPGSGDRAIFTSACNDSAVTVPNGTTVGLINLNASHTQTVTQGGTLTLENGLAIGTGATFDADGNEVTIEDGDFTNAGTYTHGNNEVTFQGSTNLNIGSSTLYDVILEGAAEVSLDSNGLTADNAFTIGSGTYFGLAGQDFEVTGTFSNEGELELSGAETVTLTQDTDSGQFTFFDDGGNSRSLAGFTTFYTVVFDDDGSDGDWTLGASIDVNGNFRIDGGTIIAGANDITLAGNWTNSDTFTDGTGTVTLDGTGTQAVSGSTEFYDFAAAASSSARTITFNDGDTFTFANTLSLTGTADYLLNVQSDSDSAVTTFVPGSSTVTVNYMSPYRVSVSGGTITCTTGCVNRGFNDGWIIASNSTTVGGGGSSTVNSTATVLSPNGGERLTAGSSTDIGWSMSYQGLDSVSIYYSADNGQSWELVADGLSNSGSYNFTVPTETTLLGKIRVVGYNASGDALIQDDSNGSFIIEAAAEGDDQSDSGSDQETGNDNDQSSDFDGVQMETAAGQQVMLEAGSLFRGESLSGVYLVNEDGTRWVFPTEHVFNSYGYSFDDVVTVKDDQLRKLQLGGRVVAAPGELVKIQSDNRVFEVQADGVLRHVPSEAYAEANYGSDWNKMITDINVVFWGDYTIGSSL